MNNINLKHDVKISPFMKDVVIEIARKHPDWVLLSNDTEEARKFVVYYKGNTDIILGHIEEEYKYVRGERQRRYLLENWRISNMRQRGCGIQTSKPKEALKAVEKYFYPLTTEENIEISFRQAHHFVSMELREARSNLDASIRNLHQPMMTFANKHWDTFLNMLDDKTHNEALNLVKYQQVSNTIKTLYKEVEDKKCLTVYLSNGKYTVQQGEVLQEYVSETLPEHIKTKVGLLKLVEDKEVLPEVGVRVNNLYVIRP